MWKIKILSGSQTGRTYSLKKGHNKIGRAESCDIQIDNPQVSKEHFEIIYRDEKFLLKDLESSNGTFVNGVRVRNTILKKGDKIAAHDVMMELVERDHQVNQRALARQTRQMPAAQMPSQPMTPAMGQQSADSSVNRSMALPKSLNEQIENYLERAVYPGLFQLTHSFDVKAVVVGFALIFIFAITLLAIFPMKSITQESVQIESKRRALTLARALAQSNEKIIRSNDISSYTTDLILREEGIDDVYIISKDGTIIAPGERVGASPKQAGFVKQIRGYIKETSVVLSNDQIAASAPIVVFDPELQQNVAKATVDIIYNPKSLTFSDGKAFSMFIQMLAIALLLGFVMFYLLAKVVEYPLVQLKKNLDEVLSNKVDHVQTSIRSQALHDVLVNINSLVSRGGVSGGPQLLEHSGINENEIRNIIKIMGFPGLLINKMGMILEINPQFEALTGYSAMQLFNQNIVAIPDQALQKNLQELIKKSGAQPQVTVNDQIEISSMMLSIQCQALGQSNGQPEFYLISFAPLTESQGGAA